MGCCGVSRKRVMGKEGAMGENSAHPQRWAGEEESAKVNWGRVGEGWAGVGRSVKKPREG